MIKYSYELFKGLPETDNRIQARRTYAGRNTSNVQSINIDDTEMGAATERNG